MTEDFKHKFDLSKPRRKYFSEDCGLKFCPECGKELIDENCTVVIAAISDTDKGEFISNLTGSHFCNSCPVVVFDSAKIRQATRLGIRGDSNFRYQIAGIVNFNAIPHEKRKLELGIEENPIPIVRFLPDLANQPIIADKKPGRNDPCACGNGKKYKKCCGK